MDEKYWYQQWFNEDYLQLYSHRNEPEAEKEVDYIIESLSLNGKESVLDLGSGTGRHLFAFAQKGFCITGVDISPFMIGKVKEKLKILPELSVVPICADIFSLPSSVGKFDLVTNLFTTFGYFEEDQKNAFLFDIVREHLNSGGKFFLDYLDPEAVKSQLKSTEELIVNGEKVLIYKKISGDIATKTIIFPNRTYQEKVKLYSFERIEKMLSSRGFTVVKFWKGYPHNLSERPRQLIYSQLN